MWRTRLLDMFPEHSWTQLVLPPRHFNWRIRGNSLQWALNEKALLSEDYDLLIATSMVDLASLRGFLPNIARIPTLLYFHENQFVYPLGDSQRDSNIEPKLVPLYSTLCADAIVFNSAYNRTTFLEGTRALLEKLPDRLAPDLLSKIEASEVIPVPLEDFATKSALSSHDGNQQLLEVIWNHRWEYDKGPKLLLLVAEALASQRSPIRLHVVGQQFRSSPAEFEKIARLSKQHAAALGIEPGYFGFIEDREDYIALLRRCDVVLSTALHDFQGLAVQEACALGCTPLVPDALVYPEYVESQFRYDCGSETGAQSELAEQCREILCRLQHWQDMKSDGQLLPKLLMDAFSLDSLRPSYARLLGRLAQQREI